MPPARRGPSWWARSARARWCGCWSGDTDVTLEYLWRDRGDGWRIAMVRELQPHRLSRGIESVSGMEETPALHLEAPREQVLERAAALIAEAWRSFDHPRADQPPIDDRVWRMLQAPLPEGPADVAAVLDDAARILDETIAQPRPRYFAFVGSSGLEIGVIGDALAACFDANMAVYAGAASEIEDQAVRWVGELIGFPTGGGAFTSGGTVSNLTALAAAREWALPGSRATGMAETSTAVYCSQEAHYSVTRAVELLGIGGRQVRALPLGCPPQAAAVRGRRRDRRRPGRRSHPGCRCCHGRHHADRCDRPDCRAGGRLPGAAGVAARRRRLRPAGGGVALHGVAPSPGSTARTRSRSTPTSGCTCRRRAGWCWCAAARTCTTRSLTTRGTCRTSAAQEHAVDVTLEYSRPFRALKLWLAFRAHGAAAFRLAMRAEPAPGARSSTRRSAPRPTWRRWGTAAALDRAVPARARWARRPATRTTPAGAGAPERRPRLGCPGVDRQPGVPAAVHRQLPHHRRGRAGPGRHRARGRRAARRQAVRRRRRRAPGRRRRRPLSAAPRSRHRCSPARQAPRRCTLPAPGRRAGWSPACGTCADWARAAAAARCPPGCRPRRSSRVPGRGGSATSCCDVVDGPDGGAGRRDRVDRLGHRVLLGPAADDCVQLVDVAEPGGSGREADVVAQVAAADRVEHPQRDLVGRSGQHDVAVAALVDVARRREAPGATRSGRRRGRCGGGSTGRGRPRRPATRAG